MIMYSGHMPIIIPNIITGVHGSFNMPIVPNWVFGISCVPVVIIFIINILYDVEIANELADNNEYIEQCVTYLLCELRSGILKLFLK